MSFGSAPLVALFIYLALNRMVQYSEPSFYNLDFGFHKIQRYEHHLINFEESLNYGITPHGLRLHKKPAIQTISADFAVRWKTALQDAGHKLVSLLLD